MKTVKIFVASIIAVCVLSSNAQTKTDVFGNSDLPVTWLGVDFSKVSVIGDSKATSPSDMLQHFNKINYLIITESQKFKLKSTFRKDKMDNNISYVEEANKSMDQDEIVTYNSKFYNKFNEDSVKKIIKNYTINANTKGVGLVFIAEALNKTIEEAAMWVTFIDIETKEVIFTERCTGKAVGLGFRNYWAGSIHAILRDIDNHKYKSWKKKSKETTI